MQTYSRKFEQLERMTSKAKNIDWHPGRMFVNQDNYIMRFFHSLYGKKDFQLSDDQYNYISNHWSLVRGIIGDGGDGIQGITGVGLATLVKHISTLKDITLERDTYNHTLSHMTFNTFDYKYTNSIFDLDKIKALSSDTDEKVLDSKTGKMVKKKPLPKVLQAIISPKGIERICRNIALMDYNVMYERRRLKEQEIFDTVYYNQNKFKTASDIETFLNNTGLWKACNLYVPRIYLNI